MEPIKISHKDYEKISDIVYSNGRLMIKLNVKLASYSDNKGRVNYHKEVGYYNDKANSVVYNINRSFEYFLSIEDFKGSYIMIGVNQYLSLVSMLEEIFKWFVDKKYHGLFARKEDGELVVNKSVRAERIDYLPMGKWLEASPKAISFNNGDYATGLRLYLSSYEYYVDLTFESMDEETATYPQGVIWINEIMADPKGLTQLPETEYVELFNTSDESISLSGWQFVYGGSPKRIDIFTIPAKGYAVLYRTGREIWMEASAIAIPMDKFPNALANAGKDLQLLDPTGNLIDQVTYAKATPGRSWERNDDGWSLCLDVRGGTPGAKNSSDEKEEEEDE